MGKAWASLKRSVDTPDAVETIPVSVDSPDTVERICPLRGVPDGSLAKAWPGQVKGAHAPEILLTESPPKSGRQVLAQSANQCVAVGGSILPALLKFNDSAPNLPIYSRHQRIDAACGRSTPCFQQCHNRAM